MVKTADWPAILLVISLGIDVPSSHLQGSKEKVDLMVIVVGIRAQVVHPCVAPRDLDPTRASRE